MTNYTPEASSDLPVIGVYYLFNILTVSISIALSVAVLNLHFRGHRKYRLPDWIKCVLFMNSDYLQISNSKILPLSYKFHELESYRHKKKNFNFLYLS